jgi:hypothetical protein
MAGLLGNLANSLDKIPVDKLKAEEAASSS